MKRSWIACCAFLLACASESAETNPASRSLASPEVGDGGPHAPPPDVAPLGTRGQVLTSKNDIGRTGANMEEDVLDVARARSLVLVADIAVDGELYAQPLVAGDVMTPSGVRTLVVVATMNDSVYAFDLAMPKAGPVWHVGAQRELGVPGVSQRNVYGNNGILSTPVIDRRTDLVYVVSRDCSSPDMVTVGNCNQALTVKRCVERLSAIELGTGTVRFTKVIEGSVPGDGRVVPFDANVQWNRPALLLVGDHLYVAFGSGPNGNHHEESFEYHGWLFRYDVAHPDDPPVVFSTTPRTAGGSIWQGGGGPASDGNRVYFATANRILGCDGGLPTAYPPTPTDAEDSVVSLPLAFASNGPGGTLPDGALVYADSRPYTAGGVSGNVFQFTNANDVGFGSSGPTLIPGSEDLVVSSKSGMVYLLDRTTMAPRQTPLSVFTRLPLQGDHSLYIHSWWGIPPVFGSLVAYRPEGAPFALVYGWASEDRLLAMRYDDATRTLTAETPADVPFVQGGGYLSLSASNGRPGTAVLWATTRSPNGPLGTGHVWAFDAVTLERLWDEDTPSFSKFTPPTVARGRLLVPSAISTGKTSLLVYAPSR